MSIEVEENLVIAVSAIFFFASILVSYVSGHNNGKREGYEQKEREIDEDKNN